MHRSPPLLGVQGKCSGEGAAEPAGAVWAGLPPRRAAHLAQKAAVALQQAQKPREWTRLLWQLVKACVRLWT